MDSARQKHRQRETWHASDMLQTIAHHDAAISSLGSRMEGVEHGLAGLKSEVHSGFVGLGSKLDRLDAQPRFNFGSTVETVLHIAVLFSMVVAGIVWVTTGQFSGVVAEQKSINARVEEQMTKRDDQINRITEKLSIANDILVDLKNRDRWVTSTKKAN